MQKKLLPNLFLIAALSGCVTLPNTKGCSVAGVMSAGAICAESVTHKKSELTLDQWIAFLEPSEAEGRAGAICRSAEDELKLKDALDQACRQLGSHCTEEMVEALEVMRWTPKP